MGAMAQKYRRIIKLFLPVAMVVFTAIIWWGDVFSFNQAALILAICLSVFVCLRLHIGRKRPESLVIVAAILIFLIAYVAQAILFIVNSKEKIASNIDLISIRSVFSNTALQAGQAEVNQSLAIVLTGFLGVLVTAIYFAFTTGAKLIYKNEVEMPYKNRRIVSNPLTVGYISILITIFFGLLRKYFGLDSPSPSGLPMGLGAIINITSAYIGPNLLLAAIFFALDNENLDKAKRLAFLSIALGFFNYILFTSKLSLIMPALYIIICQYLLGRRVVSIRTIVVLGGIILVAYPFLNLYRSAVALGVSSSDLIATIKNLYENPNHADDINRGILQVSISAIIGRLVGYDPLLILLQANPYPGSLLEYFLYGDLDKYLTYTILDFQEGMGYSPGFIGRFYYISDSHIFLLISTAVSVFLIAKSVQIFWRGKNRFIVPLILAYCLIFFTDGIRFELIRALVLSTLFIYGFLGVIAKNGTTTIQKIRS